MKIKLSTKVAIGSFVVACIGVIIFALLSYSQITKYFQENILRYLSVDVENNANDIESSIKNITHDVLTLSKSENIQKVMCASQNKFDYDAAKNLQLRNWREQIEKIFTIYMEQNRAYSQIRLIGVRDFGKEILRVDSNDGILKIVAKDDLQSKGTRYYFKDTIALKKGAVFISKIDLNKERGSIVLPSVPTIRVATPMYDMHNRVLGIIIINAKIDILFNLHKYKNLKGSSVYLTNSAGYYLFHSKGEKTFSFEFSADNRLQNDFKTLKIFTKDTEHISYSGENNVAFYAKKIKVGDSFLILAQSSSGVFLKEQSSAYTKKIFIYILLVSIMIAIFSMILTKFLTNPISKLSERAKLMAQSRDASHIHFKDIKTNDEIGELAESMEYMVTRVLSSNEELEKLAISLEEDVMERTKDQEILLSIFDKGDAVLFKWNNDEQWSISTVSRSVEKLLGYRDSEFISHDVVYAKCIYEEDLGRVTQEVEDAISSHSYFFQHKPYRLITKEKKIKWVNDYTIIVRDEESDEITHFIGYLTDITALVELNDELEKKVALGISRLRERDELLAQQSKLAAMGEMIGAIAHQWRQPLNEIGIAIQNLKYDYEDGLIDKEFLESFIEKNKEIIRFMSATIDDFRNFYRLDKTKELFDVKEAINSTLSLQMAQLVNHNITVSVSGESFEVNGRKNEFLQVILNVIDNAKDALLQKGIKNAKITIVLEENVVKICDNAGGIPEGILDRIFEPYFTTKEQGKGTGIGLYMSKMIIEENMGGQLSVVNTKIGAEFRMDFNEK